MGETALNRLIDHTLLRPEAAPEDVRRLCDEARDWNFFSVCVNTHYVELAASCVAGTRIAVCSVAGFPLGAVDTAVKAFEARRAVEHGAGEIDMVMNVGALRAGESALVRDDIAAVVEACAARALVKVIIEAALLGDSEIRSACRLVVEAGAAFVKSSTGFGPPGADPRRVRLMREAVGPDFGVKASAGIRTAALALELVAAGASRLGTSSGVQIMRELGGAPG